MIEKLGGITGYYQKAKRNTQFKMAYKKNTKKMQEALIKLQQIKQEQPKQHENTNGHSIKPGF